MRTSRTILGRDVEKWTSTCPLTFAPYTAWAERDVREVRGEPTIDPSDNYNRRVLERAGWAPDRENTWPPSPADVHATRTDPCSWQGR